MRRLLLGPVLLACAACAPTDRSEARTEPEPVRPTLPVPEPAPPAASREDGGAEPLRRRIESTIRHVRQRSLVSGNAFWTVFHGILGLGPGVELLDPKTGKRVNALDYVCAGGELRGLAFRPTEHGVDVLTLRDTQGQGHQDQFIAEMAQWGMPADRRFRVQGKDRAFMDFVRHSQMRARTDGTQELSWTIVVVSQYLGTDAAWTNAHGEPLCLEDLVRFEVDSSVEKAPCGGTHRLFGLTWAYHLHLAGGGQTEGAWKAVAQKTARYRDLARQLQNPDGTFSTRSFEGPGSDPDRQLRLNTTGHVFEWLALALPDEELKAQWVRDAANALTLLILEMRDAPIDSGSLYHAVHGLYLYHARTYGRGFAPAELTIPLPRGGVARQGNEKRMRRNLER